MSHQSLRLRSQERLRQDRIHASGPELLEALKAVINTWTGTMAHDEALRHALELIDKLEGNNAAVV